MQGTTRAAPIFLLAFAGAAGCGNPSAGPTCPNGGNGKLDVVIQGVPPGQQVDVTTDNLQPLHTSNTLLLPGGIHEVHTSVLAVSSSGEFVRVVYAAPEQSVCVKDGETATVTVTYAQVPTSNRLWSSNDHGNAELSSFGDSLLHSSSSAAPTSSGTGTETSAGGIAFDYRGNLWVADASGSLRRYPAGVVAAGGELVPDVEITSAELSGGSPGPSGIAFDPDGNLWVSVGFAGEVLEFTPPQLASSGAPSPAITIGSGLLHGTAGLAFLPEPSGSGFGLFVATSDGVARFDPPFYSGEPLNLLMQTSLGAPSGLAFGGGLWVSYPGPGVVAALSDFFSAGTITVTPAVQLTLNGGGLLNGLALDEAGGLWTPYGAGIVGRLSPAQLSVSATVTPATLISSSPSGSFDALAFYPPAGTTVYGP